MSRLSDLMSRPIAHRGFHDAQNGVIENTPTAISAAVEKNFGIEIDVQETADCRALVHHDFSLDRLVQGTGLVRAQNASDLVKLQMQTGSDRLWLLEDLLELVNGRVPLIVEIKSRSERGSQANFVRHVSEQMAQYKGPACIKSFDPDMLEIARAHKPDVLRGIVADSATNPDEYARFSRMDRFILRHMLHIPRTKPHFISYCVNDLPCLSTSFWRWSRNMPVMAWTIRTASQRERAGKYAQQMIFEGFDPEAPV